MASSSNLDNFLTNLENLPIQIRENLTLMQNVDSRQQNLIHDINKQTENYIKKKGFLKDKKKEKINSIQRQFVKAKEYGDDKVQLALQTYALVDEQIKKLDAQLALFNAKNQEKTPNTIRNIKRSSQKKNFNKNENDEIKKKQLEKGGKKTSAASGKTLLVSSVNISTNFPKNRVTGVQVGTGVARPAEVIDMPIDPNEPKFCLCNQVSFGEMIGCDNSDCPIE